MNIAELGGDFQAQLRRGLGIPIVIIMLLAMVILPLPAFLLDAFFTFNIALSLIVLLAAIYCKKPLDFAVFPTVLLVATLLRLALNIASTRVVLLNGHTGTGAAGNVVESFGSVVIGGNYAVGLVVFAILVIINFIVVTKGAGRISEVTARFTLDSMPGKQMAIDADLNAGLCTPEEAKNRRNEVREEADFYGSMDGASKFVRGDAIAGILILFINLIGGLAIGVAQHNLSFSGATETYALLTIGDGLVAQLPSLLLSTASAIIITRVSASADMGTMIFQQMFKSPRALLITAVVMGILGIVPGMPHIAFLTMAALAGAGAYYLEKHKNDRSMQEVEQDLNQREAELATDDGLPKELGWDDVDIVDTITLEVGYRLIPLVDAQQGGKLMERIKGVRKKMSQELGFLIPAVHIRDNLDLQPSTYRLSLLGVTVAEEDIYVDRHMAINPGQVFGELEGTKAKEPAYGLDAIWIQGSQREHAQSLGYTVVDPSTVIATHISQVMQDNAAELLGHEEVQQLLDRLAQQVPKLVEELVPETVSLGILVKVLQNLLDEQIPIRDMRTIAETLIEQAPKGRDPDALTAATRVSLGRMIIQNINGLDDELPVITLSPELEQILQNAVNVGGETGAGLEPGLINKLQQALVELVQRQDVAGQPAVLLVPPQIRGLLAKFSKHSIPGLSVLAYQEVPDNKQLRVVGSVGQ